MTILSVNINEAGQAGVSPRLIRLETNNTMGEVQVAGYLDPIVKEGITLTEYDLAFVSTKVSPSSKEITVGIYNVSFSGGKWSLVLYPHFLPPPFGVWLLGGNSEAGPQVLSADDDVTLQSNTGDINLLAPNPGGFANIEADDVHITGNTNVIVDGSTFDFHSSGVTSIVADTDLTLQGAQVFIPGLTSATTANVVYYDTVTGKLTYDPAGGGGFDPTANYDLSTTPISGSWVHTGKFNVASQNHDIVLSNSTIIPPFPPDNLGDFFIYAQKRLSIGSETGNTEISSDTGEVNITAFTDASLTCALPGGVLTLTGDQVGCNFGVSTLFQGGAGSTFGVTCDSSLSLSTADGPVNISASGAGGIFTISGSQNSSISSLNNLTAQAGDFLALEAVSNDVTIDAQNGSIIETALGITLSTNIPGGTGIDLIAAVDLGLTAFTGSIFLSAATDIELNAVGSTRFILGTVASVAAAPTISLPVGYSYVVAEDATGNVFRMS